MKFLQMNFATNQCYMYVFMVVSGLTTFAESKYWTDELKHNSKRSSSFKSVFESNITTLQLAGVELAPDTLIALTQEPGPMGSQCNETLFILKNIPSSRIQGSATEIKLDASLPPSSKWYLCIYQSSNLWNDHRDMHWTYVAKFIARPSSREFLFVEDITEAKIFGVRAEGDRVFITEGGFSLIPANVNVTIRVFGVNFSENTELAFTGIRQQRGSRCESLPITRIVTLSSQNIINNNVVKVQVSLPLSSEARNYFICIKKTFENGNAVQWVHQGDEPWLRLEVVGRILPMWLQICLILCLLCLSGLFSGLNLGLMALDRLELQVIENCGTETEKKYARTISPLRNRGNYLLCSLLLGNVLVNSTLTILLDDLTSGIIAIVGSTMSIVIIGEIIPQALCSRHGLSIGARTVWVTKFFMFATFPLSFPISKILDCMLGEEIGNVYDRERLMEYIRVTKPYNKLENEEVNIISGALELKTKTVSNVMTKIDDVFMIPYDAVLNFETMSEIMKQGYSRIPVFDGDRNNIVALLNIKDLAFVDPDDNSLLRTLCEFYNHPTNYVFEDETLDVMLNEFKKGQSHMAFVRHVNNEGDGDPFYEIIGVVTLEDVIEEILQSEIIDETDILTDNRRKQRRKEAQTKQDFSEFAKIGGGQQGRNVISPQLALATYQYLSTSVEPFKKTYLSEIVLKRLMSQNIFFNVKQSLCNTEEITHNASSVLFEAGKAADYFVLILEGRCRVTVGKENLIFETGSFSYFGVPALALNFGVPGEVMSPIQSSSSQTCIRTSALSISIASDNGSLKNYIPDYTVVCICPTLYMKIHWTVYLAAYRATVMERQKLDPDFEYSSQSNWEHDVFMALSPEEVSVQNHSNSTVRGASTSTNMNKIVKQIPKSHESAIRRASVEVGCLSRYPDTVVVMDGTFGKLDNNECLVKSPGFGVPSDIPMIDICHNLSSVLENEGCSSIKDVKKKKVVDNVTLKKIQVNGSKEQTNERTRLLYPSEA